MSYIEEIKLDLEPMDYSCSLYDENFTHKQSHYATESVISEGIKTVLANKRDILMKCKFLNFLFKNSVREVVHWLNLFKNQNSKVVWLRWHRGQVKCSQWKIPHIQKFTYCPYCSLLSRIDICRHFFNPPQPAVCNYTSCNFFMFAENLFVEIAKKHNVAFHLAFPQNIMWC